MSEAVIPPRRAAPARLDRFYLLPLLALAYVVSGRLGLLASVPPGYATAIFPPAGIAVASVLIAGRASLPWVFLGSLVLNLWNGYGVNGAALPAAASAAGAIALGSAVQAGFAGFALRRAIGYPMALDNGHDLLRFLVLSPACCLVSATLSLGGLWLLGAVGGAALWSSYLTWWVGDTLGVLVVLPLLMVVAGEPRPLWRARALPVALPMLLFFGFFIAVFIRVSAWENDQLLLEFRLRSQETVDRVRTRLEEQEIFLEQLARPFAHGPAMTPDGFAGLVEGAAQRFPMVQAIAWAPRRGDAAGPATYPVTYLAPLGGKGAKLGADLLADPVRRAAATRALASGGVVATAPTGFAAVPGIDLLRAVPGGSNGSGLLMVALRTDKFVAGLLEPTNDSLDLRLLDLAQWSVLYDGFPPGSGAPIYRQTLAFGGRSYDVETVPSAAYLRQHRGWQSWALLVAGVFGTGLLGTLLMLGTGYASRIERQVEARTGDLAAVNRQLRIEIDERRQAEEALRQAQRMEAIGRLTGGVAHDFNNLLTVISANAELIRRDAADEIGQRRADGILRAAERGERLTRQLLAFSRRQMLRPEPTDLRHRLAELAEMLSRSLRPDIELTLTLPEDLWPVAIDPAEFELALLNIAVNARDAMPRGGRFDIAAANRALAADDADAHSLAGDFVALTLSDTGEGMDEAVLNRAFEPYFTTKPVGAGSGLGLSQVYGFASQSGGAVSLASTPGVGTAIALLLPRAPETAPTVRTAPPRAASVAPVKILVVEDEPEIADLTATMLGELGYGAVHAPDAASALAVLARDPGIGLVVTDIVMPGAASGLDLARALRQDRPGLPVLLVTGYTRQAAEVAGEGFDLLEKPYRREALAAAVQAALERPARDDGEAASRSHG